MNNLQLYLSIGIPSFLVILSWLSNRADIAALRGDMAALRGEMIAMRRDMNSEFTAFRREIYTEMVGLHERVVKVETRQANS